MRRFLVVMLVAALGMLGEAAIVSSSAGASAHGKAQHSVVEKKKKRRRRRRRRRQRPRPQIKITPTDNLTDGQAVTVAGSGYKPGLSLGINECADKADQTGAATATSVRRRS